MYVKHAFSIQPDAQDEIIDDHFSRQESQLYLFGPVHCHWLTANQVYAQKQSMYGIQSMLQQEASAFKDVTVLGTFLDNHDVVRFLVCEYFFTSDN